MIKYTSSKQLAVDGFDTEFRQKLNPNNKWVILADAIPWDEFVSIYTEKMSRGMGRTSISPRLAISAMIIKHLENLDDRGVVEALEENLYMQYFAGYSGFSNKRPFDPSLMVRIRLRMGKEAFDQMSLLIIQKAIPILEQMKTENKKGKFKNGPKNNSNNRIRHTDKNDNNDDQNTGNQNIELADKKENIADKITPEITDEIIPENTADFSENAPNVSNQITENAPNKGTLIVDATVADQMIKFPTDIGILNTARLETERLIDIIYDKSNLEQKPRTYRVVARKEFMALAKKKNKSVKQIHKIKGKQLRYLNRNINIINSLLDTCSVMPLSYKDLRLFWIIRTVYDQQRTMYINNTRSHPDRIVSIYQPYVRPIPRGKDKHSTEFGAKIGVSVLNGFSMVDTLNWNAYSESKDMVIHLENYRRNFGYYPEFLLADKAYLTRENRELMKLRNIVHSGKPLGRPAQLSSKEKAKIKAKNAERNHVEGKFGQAKNTFGLSRIRARRADTSAAWISGIFMAMNLTRLLKIMPVVGLILLFMAENALSAQIMGLLRRFEGQVRAAGQRNWRWVKEVWQQVWRVDEPKMALVYG